MLKEKIGYQRTAILFKRMVDEKLQKKLTCTSKVVQATYSNVYRYIIMYSLV